MTGSGLEKSDSTHFACAAASSPATAMIIKIMRAKVRDFTITVRFISVPNLTWFQAFNSDSCTCVGVLPGLHQAPDHRLDLPSALSPNGIRQERLKPPGM